MTIMSKIASALSPARKASPEEQLGSLEQQIETVAAELGELVEERAGELADAAAGYPIDEPRLAGINKKVAELEQRRAELVTKRDGLAQEITAGRTEAAAREKPELPGKIDAVRKGLLERTANVERLVAELDDAIYATHAFGVKFGNLVGGDGPRLFGRSAFRERLVCAIAHRFQFDRDKPGERRTDTTFLPLLIEGNLAAIGRKSLVQATQEAVDAVVCEFGDESEAHAALKRRRAAGEQLELGRRQRDGRFVLMPSRQRAAGGGR